MQQEELQFAVRGAMIHAPAAGEIEILHNALIAVDKHGTNRRCNKSRPA